MPIVRRSFVAVLLAVAAPAALLPAQQPASRLGWLAGCWERRAGAVLVEEQWMQPRGGIMLGMSRTVRGDSVVEYETLRIYESRDTLVYAAHPSRQQPSEFRATDTTTATLRFENLAHDFPQRIIYRPAAGRDSLIARIEGTRGGKTRAVDYPYRRVSCS